MDRSTIYYFILVFHSNYWPILYRFRERGFPWNYVMAEGIKKLD